MPFVTPSTQGASSVIPTSRLNAYKTAVDFLATTKPHVEVYSTATQSIPNAVATDVLFPSETHDVGGWHSTSSNTDRCVVPTGEPAKYNVLGGCTFASDADGYRQVKLTKNGIEFTPARLVLVNAVTTGGMALQVAAMAQTLAAGDIIRLQVLHTAGGALDIDDAYLSISWYATS